VDGSLYDVDRALVTGLILVGLGLAFWFTDWPRKPPPPAVMLLRLFS
jgi:hypothetical protein